MAHCFAPSSTLVIPGVKETETSLAMVTLTVADFAVSASLVAVTCTIPVEGRSAGAVKTPLLEMIPVCPEPPAMPLTAQTTVVFVVFKTVALKLSVVPSRTVPLAGVTWTLMEEGGGVGGATEPAPPPPQPRVHAPIARSTNAGTNRLYTGRAFSVRCFVSRVCGRGRMSKTQRTRGTNGSFLVCLLAGTIHVWASVGKFCVTKTLRHSAQALLIK